MRRRLRRFAIVPTLAIGLVAFAGSPAGAQSLAAAVVSGSGTISPGVSLTPANQSFTFTSTTIDTIGVVDGNVDGLGNSSRCTASGGSIGPETTANGQGQGSWACSTGPLTGDSGSLTYVRVGAAVLVALAPGSLTGALACDFTPTQGDGVTAPITAYDLLCVGAGAAA